MKFLPYEDVPLFLGSEDGNDSEYIFAESASLSLSQPLRSVRYTDDNVLQICAFNNGNSVEYTSPTFNSDTFHTALLGPSGGPPQPLSTSIYKIPSGTKITFPNDKHLYFSGDVFPDGHNYLVNLQSKDSTWNLSEGEAQSGYFDPVYNYVADGPVQGTLDVNFYINTGNLKSFFNITGLSSSFPPIDEQKLTGFFGNFKFSCAHLNSLDFSLSPNSISQAKATFAVYGVLEEDTTITDTYYSSDLYQQQSIPHGEDSSVIGASQVGIDHPVSFSYNISVDRTPTYCTPTGKYLRSDGTYNPTGDLPKRVSKKSVSITTSIAGENIDPNILSEGLNGKRANIDIHLQDLNYQNFEDNSNGFLHAFNSSGVITEQSLSVNSAGYLNGSVKINQLFR